MTDGDIPARARQQCTMNKSWQNIDGAQDSPLLLIADHASNHVPDDINLGIATSLLDTHIAIDIGVANLGRTLCQRMGFPGILGGVSRLVVDLNREEDAPHVIPIASDGHAIAGNAISHNERMARINRYWKPYHKRVAEKILEQKPKLLISLHSFTPELESEQDVVRPWQVGILYNQDDRAARIAIPALAAAGVIVGDQQPYSGKILNATMNRHGEENRIAYLGIEMRQDLIADGAGVTHWAKVLEKIIHLCVTNPVISRNEKEGNG
jgi:predicted N-formylglutamate amidohydrolase